MVPGEDRVSNFAVSFAAKLEVSFAAKLGTHAGVKSENTEHVAGVKSENEKRMYRSPWSRKQDEIVRACVKKYGECKWARIALLIPGRTGKQCRERWHNQLRPGIKTGAWSASEDARLIEV